jgi:8-oxo-dGTP pyrophosphatase MutT (NUDIX family)
MNGSDGTIRQAAALIVHHGKVCLVTATSGRRWILPKGTLEPGQSAAECAVAEAWEEAGILGRPGRRAIAKYAARKYGRPCLVSVFRLDVKSIADDWPERDVRRRSWVSVEKALALVDVPAIRELLRELDGASDKLVTARKRG